MLPRKHAWEALMANDQGTASRHDRLYGITHIGRPVDPAYPTNRAVLIGLPIVAVAAAAFGLAQGFDLGDSLRLALKAALTLFGAWALGRELAPDDNPGAFIAAALALAALFYHPQASLLLLFTALFLLRIVNRSTGLAPKPTDSVIVLLLAGWAAWEFQAPLIGAVGALAFAFDALLKDGARSQLVFAALLLGLGIFIASEQGFAFAALPAPGSTIEWAAVATVVLFGFAALTTRRVTALGDRSGTALDVTRVRAGMLVGLILAAVFLPGGPVGAEASALVWASLAGIGIGRLGQLARS